MAVLDAAWLMLTGAAPDAPIGPELIAKLRLHRDFAAEALGAVGAGGADELSTSLAIAIFVRLNRMFELNLSKGAEQPQGAAPRTLARSVNAVSPSLQLTTVNRNSHGMYSKCSSSCCRSASFFSALLRAEHPRGSSPPMTKRSSPGSSENQMGAMPPWSPDASQRGKLAATAAGFVGVCAPAGASDA